MAVTSSFCHNQKATDWWLAAKTIWNHFRPESFQNGWARAQPWNLSYPATLQGCSIRAGIVLRTQKTLLPSFALLWLVRDQHWALLVSSEKKKKQMRPFPKWHSGWFISHQHSGQTRKPAGNKHAGLRMRKLFPSTEGLVAEENIL